MTTLRALALSVVLAAILATLEMYLGVVTFMMSLVILCAIGFTLEAVIVAREDRP